MSQIFSKSPKHCAEKQTLTIHKSHKKLLFSISSFFIIVLAFIFLVWLTLHPSKPRFSLTQLDIYQLGLTRPSLLNSSIQLTFLSKNPNQRVGVYYDELQAYASYKGQQITVYTPIPPFYQGHQESNLLTAFLQGNALPVAPSFGYDVARDQSAGRMVFSLRAIGKIRWKVGTWVSGRYRFNVNCVSVMVFRPNTAPASPFIGSSTATRCSTDV
ncbi:NDR1/HIN1-like protein 26 [Hibiscus syriacus]|uniref:NDR1/HIN1-like protein 26 n=1 Tax=Hibiscus syriacus TaxID=106335 RepID=UPI001920888A|nr:NDR1/HIN1-like protein 26 [Hibiscus syriacus]